MTFLVKHLARHPMHLACQAMHLTRQTINGLPWVKVSKVLNCKVMHVKMIGQVMIGQVMVGQVICQVICQVMEMMVISSNKISSIQKLL